MISGIFGEKCFRCKKTRTKKEYDGLPTCDACTATLQAKAQADSETARTCVDCAVKMQKLVVQNVVVDKCSECGGVWLDAGELYLIQEAAASDGSGDFVTGMVVGMAAG